jgi:hypothetical protein
MARPAIPPTTTVPHDPVEQSLLETDIVSNLLAFDPLVTKDLLTLREKLPVEHGITNKGNALVVGGIHKRENRHGNQRGQV